MIKFLRIMCFVTISMFLIVGIVGKTKLKHINYDDYISTASYYTSSISSVYSHFSKLEQVIIDDSKIKNIEDLFLKSEYVLKVRINTKPTIYGNGILNKVEVLDILKGENDKNITKGNIIKVYDLVSIITDYSIRYYGGMTPLDEKNEYIIFIKKAPHPSIKNTYLFSSITYGHFNISSFDSNILMDYEPGSLTIKEAMKYDYVQTDCKFIRNEDCDQYATNYSTLKKQLLEYLKEF